jgi:hypothetical protein
VPELGPPTARPRSSAPSIRRHMVGAAEFPALEESFRSSPSMEAVRRWPRSAVRWIPRNPCALQPERAIRRLRHPFGAQRSGARIGRGKPDGAAPYLHPYSVGLTPLAPTISTNRAPPAMRRRGFFVCGDGTRRRFEWPGRSQRGIRTRARDRPRDGAGIGVAVPEITAMACRRGGPSNLHPHLGD